MAPKDIHAYAKSNDHHLSIGKKNSETTQCPYIRHWLNRVWPSHSIYSCDIAIKRRAVGLYVVTWENIQRYEVKQIK